MTFLRQAMARLRAPGRPLLIGGLIAASVYLVVLAWAMDNTSFDAWGALVVGPALVAITVPIAIGISRHDNDGLIAQIIVAALLFKMIGALVRYYVAFDVYGGIADATGYAGWGEQLAPVFRSGGFTVDVGRELVGTGFIRAVTGVVFAVTGSTTVGGFFVFSWISFVGLIFFYLAFRLAVPGGDSRRYALLVFFLPSLLFWPSSIGKEAWMIFGLGIIAYGAARLMTHRHGGFMLAGVGLFATAMVRPHVTLIAFVALAVAYLLRGPERPSLVSPVVKGLGLVIVVVTGLLLVSQVEEFFGISNLDQQGVDQVLESTEEQTSQGGSEFEAPGSPSIVGFPRSLVTVLFRPFPHEAGNGAALLASFEGVFLIGLVIASLDRFRAVSLRQPYVLFAIAFSVVFVLAFGTFGNFGIVVRQRSQLLPFFLVLLALPRPSIRRGADPKAGALHRDVTMRS